MPFRRRPLVGVGLVFSLGTYAGLAGHPPLQLNLLIGALLLELGLILGSRFRPALRPIALGWALLTGAWLHAGLRTLPESRLPAAFRFPTDQPVTVEGLVVSDPLMIARPRNQPPLCAFDLEVATPASESDPIPAALEVAVVLARPAGMRHPPLPRFGDAIRIRGHLQRKSAPVGHHRFELRATDSESTRTRLSGRLGNPLAAYCYERRREAARQLDRGIEGDRRAQGVIRSLVLGYRRQIDSRLYRVFAATGTLHIFAVSGSHVAILTLFTAMIARSLRLPRPRWILLWAPVLLFYTVATGMEPSAVRACIMALALAGAWAANRSGDLFSITALAALILLLIDPAHLTDPGFILSFVTVIGLSTLIPPVWEGLTARWAREDAWDPPGPPPFRRKIFRWLRRAGAGLIVTSAAAWLVSLPLNLYYFKLFSWVSLPGNLITLPLAFLLMLSGGLALAVGAIWPGLGLVFNHANWLLARILIAGLEALYRLPQGHFKIDRFPAWAVWLYYALAALAILWLHQRRKPSETQAV